MTPKEKAFELVHMYDIMQTYIEEFNIDDAKQCAWNTVKEIEDIIINSDNQDLKNYWQEVKHEIEKL
jgi:hypothetical protein